MKTLFPTPQPFDSRASVLHAASRQRRVSRRGARVEGFGTGSEVWTIKEALASLKRAPRDERQLQEWMAEAFDRAGIGFHAEVPTGAGPVDFVVENVVAVEVKVAGSARQVFRQVQRYLEHLPSLREAVIVATKPMILPAEFVETSHGKRPLAIVALWRNYL